MPIYVYETTDTAKPVRQFEIKQSMAEPPLRFDPETNEPVRRIISGGYGLMKSGTANSSPKPSGGSCGSGCGCH